MLFLLIAAGCGDGFPGTAGDADRGTPDSASPQDVSTYPESEQVAESEQEEAFGQAWDPGMADVTGSVEAVLAGGAVPGDDSAEPDAQAAAGPVVMRPVTLEPGMAAPELDVLEVVHGPAFSATPRPGRIRVVEFWATWCRPSQFSIRRMHEVKERMAHLVELIAITTEDPERVREFLGQQAVTGGTWGELADYSIAVDRDSRSFARYMDAAGQERIPCVFVTDRSGRIAWIGSPVEMDPVLEQIRDGRFDLDRSVRLFRARRRMMAAAWNEDVQGILEVLRELAEFREDEFRMLLMQLELLSVQRLYEEFGQLARTVMADRPDDAAMMNHIAWTIATAQGRGRDLNLAMSAAMRASEKMEHRHAGILDTVARVFYEQGDAAEALNWQKRAVQIQPYSLELQSTLRFYERQLNRQAESIQPSGETSGTPSERKSAGS